MNPTSDALPKNICSLIKKKKFFPSSVILDNYGKSNHLHATHVIDVVKDALSVARKVHATGAGIGFDARKHANVVDFIRDLDAQSTDYVKACASCVTIPVWHSELPEVLALKRSPTDFMSVVIQIGVSDSFIDAVKQNEDFALRDPEKKEVSEIIPARRLFEEIISCVSRSGNPGILFLDTINKNHPFPQMVTTTDVCGVAVLNSGESAPLGSVNLGEVDEDLEEVVRVAVRFLDMCVDKNVEVDGKFGLSKKRRKIVLGVMGVAEFLEKKGIEYDSDEGRALIGGIMEKMYAVALDETQALAKSLGKIPDMNQVSSYGTIPIRNSLLLGIAPTGTISGLADVTPGIAPLHKCVGEGQVRMQATVQKHVDHAVSNTILCSADEIEKLLFLAHEQKCKGVSFFVENKKKIEN